MLGKKKRGGKSRGKRNPRGEGEGEEENYCSPVLARLVSTAVWFTARRIFSVNSVRRYSVIEKLDCPVKAIKFLYGAVWMWIGFARACSLCWDVQGRRAECYVVLYSYFGHRIKMYRDRRSDGLKRKKKESSQCRTIHSVDWIYLSEGNEYYRERQLITAIPRWMCATAGITKVFPSNLCI